MMWVGQAVLVHMPAIFFGKGETVDQDILELPARDTIYKEIKLARKSKSSLLIKWKRPHCSHNFGGNNNTHTQAL